MTVVEQTIIRMVNDVDRKEWSVVREQFTDSVFVDYSSLNGAAGAKVSSAVLVGGWQSLLVSVANHHMVSNFEVNVDGSKASSECHVYACHTVLNLEGWDYYGRYLHTLEQIQG